MARLRQLAWMALAAGIAAGLLLSVLQAVWITPLILAAERYEHQAPAGSDREARGGSSASGGAAAPEVRRTAWSVAGNLAAAVGFALALGAAATLRGAALNVPQGLAWGLAGYACFVLAPALGLPPELPGMTGAPLAERQAWWAATVAATAAGLWVVFFAPVRFKAAGLLVVLAPHLWGAPHPPPGVGGAVPAWLAADYAASVLVVNAVFWAVLGAGLGWAARRGGQGG